MLEPVLEEGELFDAIMLKQITSDEIGKGNRNFVLDCSPLDYIYSDTINALLSLNRRILDVSGRLSLMGPGPEVTQTLKKTGVHNILKIYASEMELQKSSEDIILQTSSFRLTDIQKAVEAAAEPAKAESEYDELRSQMGTALGPPEPQADLAAPPQYAPADMYQQYPPQQYAPPQGPMQQMPQQQVPDYLVTPAPMGYQPSPQQRAGQRAPGYMVTPPPQAYPQAGQQPQPFFEPQPQMPVPREAPRFEPPAAEIAPPKKPAVSDFERFDEGLDEDFLGKHKKSHVATILVTVVLLIAVSAAAFFGVKYYRENFVTKQAKTAVVPPPAKPVVPVVPEVPASVPAPEAAVASTTPAAPAVAQPQPARPAPRPAAQPSAPQEQPVVRTTRAPRRERPAPTAQPRQEPAAPAVSAKAPGSNVLTITSSPSGASVTVDGKFMGVTPFEWKNPFFGGMKVAVSKDGFMETSRSMEYTGGKMQEFFSLTADESARAPQVEQPRASAPASEPDFPSSPEPAPERSAPVQPAPPPSASSEPTGEPATVFISSLPPVADVYMDGQMIGKTNVAELKVRSGSHSMKFVKGGKEFTKEMSFTPGKNASQMVRIP